MATKGKSSDTTAAATSATTETAPTATVPEVLPTEVQDPLYQKNWKAGRNINCGLDSKGKPIIIKKNQPVDPAKLGMSVNALRANIKAKALIEA